MADYIVDEFINDSNAFGYSYEKVLQPGEIRLLKLPRVSPNKRGVNDIGFVAEEGITLYATLSSMPQNDTAIWQQVNPFDEINKTTTYLKIANSSVSTENDDGTRRINIRAILN